MKLPSKRAHEQAKAEAKRLKAIEENNPKLFAQACKELEAANRLADSYTCACCGEDFPHGPHLEILAAAVLVFDDEGRAVVHYDYGLLPTARGENGRRFKFCKDCMDEWQIHPAEYVDMR